MSPVLAYLALAGAIVSEVTGSSLLMKTEQFTKLYPTIGVGICFLFSLFFLSIALKVIPLGIAYAIWAGLGIVLTATISVVFLRQSLDLPAYIGIALIVTGVVIMNALSKAATH